MRVATQAQLTMFASEGYVLVGAAALAHAPRQQAGKPEDSPDARSARANVPRLHGTAIPRGRHLLRSGFGDVSAVGRGWRLPRTGRRRTAHESPLKPSRRTHAHNALPIAAVPALSRNHRLSASTLVPPRSALEAATSTNALIQIFDMRIVPRTGLLYVGSAPLTGGAADLQSSPARASPGRRAPPPPAAAAEPAVAGGGGGSTAAEDGAARALERRGGGGAVPPIRSTDWKQVGDLQPYPLTAIGFIEAEFGPLDYSCRCGQGRGLARGARRVRNGCVAVPPAALDGSGRWFPTMACCDGQ
jgi:hypothetical protein